MVNGSQNVMFRDVVSLNNTFEVNRDYIGEENEVKRLKMKSRGYPFP